MKTKNWELEDFNYLEREALFIKNGKLLKVEFDFEYEVCTYHSATYDSPEEGGELEIEVKIEATLKYNEEPDTFTPIKLPIQSLLFIANRIEEILVEDYYDQITECKD
jgi:hypothetical protein